jgi:crossover junction endodeoxyribonuclease RuvC
MRVMGIDPATHTGYVLLEVEEDTITLSHYEMYTPPPKVKGMEKLAYIGGRLNQRMEEDKPDLVVLEGYSFASKHAIVTMAEIGTIYRYFMWQAEQSYIELAPTSLKKFVTGVGNCKKELILKEVYKVWGFDTNDNNISDAYGLAMYGAYQHLGILDGKGGYNKTLAKNIKIINKSNYE